MPQANDAELTELYTAPTGVEVEDNEPNTGPPGGAPSNTFDLRLQAVAGNVIGNGGADYRLEIRCIDETRAEPNNNMSPGVLNQEFLPPLWQASGAAGNFLNEQRFTINVDPNARGHVLRYVASLVTNNRDVVSFIESNKFILV